MTRLILLFLILTPLIEIAVFIQVGGLIGLWPTIATVILTALIGTALLRRQGLATLARAQREMEAKRLPVRELFTGVCLLLAGALLLTPGFVTDAVGFALLLPPVREVIGTWLWRYFSTHSGFRVSTPSVPGDTVLEGDFHEVDPEDDDNRRLRPD